MVYTYKRHFSLLEMPEKNRTSNITKHNTKQKDKPEAPKPLAQLILIEILLFSLFL